LRASEASQRTQTPKTETAGNVSCGQDQRPTDQNFKVREKSSDRLPNGWAHLPPVLARRQSLKTTFSTKVPLCTHAEGGQVEPVLGNC